MAKESKEDTMESFFTKQREGAQKKRDDIQAQITALEQELTGIDRQLAAMDAYERTLRGELEKPARKPRATNGGGGKRGRRKELFELIKSNPNGMSRADLILALNGKGDKKTEQMVSNALAVMKKNNQLTLENGTYRAA